MDGVKQRLGNVVAWAGFVNLLVVISSLTVIAGAISEEFQGETIESFPCASIRLDERERRKFFQRLDEINEQSVNSIIFDTVECGSGMNVYIGTFEMKARAFYYYPGRHADNKLREQLGVRNFFGLSPRASFT